jgi:ethanolamine kinase
MPSQSQRLDFIKYYVDAFRRCSDVHEHTASSEQAVEQLYQQVDLFRGLPGYYWGIWGLIQASISDIDFDFAAYAERRHSEYWGWKAEYDGSRVREGLEATVREQAWARK